LCCFSLGVYVHRQTARSRRQRTCAVQAPLVALLRSMGTIACSMPKSLRCRLRPGAIQPSSRRACRRGVLRHTVSSAEPTGACKPAPGGGFFWLFGPTIAEMKQSPLSDRSARCAILRARSVRVVEQDVDPIASAPAGVRARPGRDVRDRRC